MRTVTKIGRLIIAASISGIITPSFAMEEPQQGAIIVCEECVILYPEKYKDEPESCPVCRGRKEHFQPARFMSGELAEAEGRELELRIESFLFQKIKNARESPVSSQTFREIRGYYMEKLIFHLVHDQFEPEPIKSRIYELDELIGKSQ